MPKIKQSNLHLLALLLVTTSAIAEEGVTTGVDHLPGYIGALLGVNIPANSGANTTTAIGVTLGTKVNSFLGVGLFGSYYGQISSGPYLGLPGKTEMSVTLVTAQGNYYFWGFHFGGEIGAAIRSWSGVNSTLSGGSSTTTLLLGAVGGYDHKISRNLSIGAEVHSFFPGSATEVNSIQILAAVKIWL